MSTQYVTNRIGEIIGKIEKIGDTTYVYNKIGETAGRCANGYTYNAIGEVISHTECPGLLIRE